MSIASSYWQGFGKHLALMLWTKYIFTSKLEKTNYYVLALKPDISHPDSKHNYGLEGWFMQ